MATLRLMFALRRSLLTARCYRMLELPLPQVFFQSAPLIPSQPICLFSTSMNYQAQRRNKGNVSATEEVENEEEDDDDDDGGDTDQNEQEKIRQTIQEHKLPKGYRIIIRQLASLRLDLICSAATGMGRSTIEDEFYGSKLRVNGEKSTKKAQQVKEGDVIDLVVSRIDGARYNSKRIVVYKVFDEKSLKNKVKVCLIAWRQGIEVDGSQWS